MRFHGGKSETGENGLQTGEKGVEKGSEAGGIWTRVVKKKTPNTKSLSKLENIETSRAEVCEKMIKGGARRKR